jgi:hypothetical protein
MHYATAEPSNDSTETTMMKTANTAYATAVGPSSLVRHRRIFEATLHILEFLLKYFQEPSIRGNVVGCSQHATDSIPPARLRASRFDYELRELLTELNVPLTLVPSDLTAAAQTAMIRANITPYSTAVGPSSLTKKRCTFETKLFIANSCSGQLMNRLGTQRATAALSRLMRWRLGVTLA